MRSWLAVGRSKASTCSRAAKPFRASAIAGSTTSTALTSSRTAILLASAGSDLIVEVTPRGEPVWDWFGPEHGYDRQPCGKPAFCDRDADYRTIRRRRGRRRCTSPPRSSVTSAPCSRHSFTKARWSPSTEPQGRVVVKMRDLSRPHGIHRQPAGRFLPLRYAWSSHHPIEQDIRSLLLKFPAVRNGSKTQSQSRRTHFPTTINR